jgi:hypothetical protein
LPANGWRLCSCCGCRWAILPRRELRNVVIARGQNTGPISLVVAGQCNRLALRGHGEVKTLQVSLIKISHHQLNDDETLIKISHHQLNDDEKI